MSLTCHAFIATSLDGFIARPDGSIDWLDPFNTGSEDHGYDAFIASIDGIIMGRGTFETVRQFAQWPYAQPVIVLSQSLTVEDVPADLADIVVISDMAPADLVTVLAFEGWRRVYVDGGRVLQSFLQEGLLDEITQTRVPVLLGQGRPLFGSLPEEVSLTHQTTRSFPSGLVSSTYRIAR
ncbi:dihydrofolate reductase [Pseudorhodobacter turbinis]|uniref:Dihydrofolate reductase n=1 Tax=Pseudorhodobacter turbinis TaxID=2500533 RepID=A0A4P8EH31_9RHOB|nr:dihydrofolate reductase family protein [Pseudorhodobacter turbinis]QCO56177.1 dihydrofolate reductase [Pseudorhodobacter turbinis]